MNIALLDLAHDRTVALESIPVPLNIGYIKAYADKTHNNNLNIKLYKQASKYIEDLEHFKPEIIGFSNYGWNENLNKAVGNYTRKVLPNSLIVSGGPNLDPGDLERINFFKSNTYVDLVIVDGGEEPFSEIVSWFKATPKNKGKLPENVLWMNKEKLIYTGNRPLKKQITNILSPYLSGALDEFLELGMVPLFETNRGCPFKCAFCAWGSASKDLVRRMDLEVALEEIKYVGKRSKAKNWIVCDANFGLLKRDVELAKAIRKVKDETSAPDKCHIWLAKNATDRNLEIAEIMGDMIVPVMAVQSLADEVLKNISRDNISTETYASYQRRFHEIGSKTYSDTIVPLPGETLISHIDGLKKLIGFGVDIIQNHNMRLLPGAKTNSSEMRKKYRFKTKFRLIHGESSIIHLNGEKIIKAFEYEESLRSTTTMSEKDIFYLRKLHFLVDFCWNIEVYKPLLKVCKFFNIDPIDVLIELIDKSASKTKNKSYTDVGVFFEKFDKSSIDEWFNSRNEIESFFSKDDAFNKLLNNEFDKLNILYSVVLLKDFKESFDSAILDIIKSFNIIPKEVLTAASKVSFVAFPPLNIKKSFHNVHIPNNFYDLNETTAIKYKPSKNKIKIEMSSSNKRRKMLAIIESSSQNSLSKILNTQGFSLSDLKLVAKNSFAFDNSYRRADIEHKV